MSIYNNKLVYGKNPLERIVSIEVVDPNIEVYIQQEDGSIRTEYLPNKYWILSEQAIPGAVRLQGNLHYKYGKQYTERDEYTKFKSIYGKSRDVYSVWNAQESAMIKDGLTYYKGLNPKDVSIMSIDIETTGLDPHAKDAKLLLVSTTYRAHDGTITKKLFAYDEFETTESFVNALNAHIIKLNPSIITGHNIISFDAVYLNVVAEKAGTALNWGRDGSPVTFSQRESKFRLDGSRDLHYHDIKIFGREVVDTYFLAIKYDVGRSMESYGLKSLIAQLQLEKENRAFYDAGLIRKNYMIPQEWLKIKNYCIDDADDAIKLWDLMGPLFFYTTQMVPKPFGRVVLSASGSQINAMMLRSYLQEGHSIPKTTETAPFKGALSWGKPGIYNNVAKFDVAAMYPSIILAHSVFDKNKDPKGNVLELVKIFRKNRLEYKRLAAETGLKSYQDMDIAAKGILNSFYGFYGATGLNFNSPACAEFITKTGREVLMTAVKWATGKEYDEVIQVNSEENEIEEE